MPRAAREARETREATPDLARALADVERILAHACDAEDALLAEMARRTVGSGGKRLRPRIMLLSYAACGGSRLSRRLLEAAAGLELVHAATLIHDDIIDDADLRRGQPAVQRAYGVGRAIVAGDFLFTKGFELSARQDEKVVALTARFCTRVAEGELLEIQLMNRADLDLRAYLAIVERKTAAPLEVSARVGAHFAGRDDLEEPLGRYGHHLGVAFQVTDDLLDLRGDPSVTGKPLGTDLRGGAPNAAVLLAMRDGARGRLEALLRRKRRRPEAVRAAIRAVLASGAAEKAERLAREHAGLAAEALAALPESAAKRELRRLALALPRRAR